MGAIVRYASGMRWLAAIVIVLSGTQVTAAPVIDVLLARTLLPGEGECGDVECLIERTYKPDAKAKQLALALWADRGDVAGVGPDEIMDGGYRGKIHLVPQLPIGSYRRHLAWVAEATRSIDKFFIDVFTDQAAPSYRWRGLAFRFVRSIKKRTPSAYATSWTIEYNVEGSLLTSAASVRETLFHELFHNNDEDHGDWSANHLQSDYDAILAKCSTTRAEPIDSGPQPPTARQHPAARVPLAGAPTVKCLAPYAPNHTMVRGGTYYAFQQNNGNAVHEYAAELAVRYFKEQSDMLTAGKLGKPAFKCGPMENARAWQALVEEFFAGRDLVPAC